MTHDIHDHNLGKTGNEKCIFQNVLFLCLFSRFIWNVHELFVPLQCQMKGEETPDIKDKNCED